MLEDTNSLDASQLDQGYWTSSWLNGLEESLWGEFAMTMKYRKTPQNLDA